MYRALCTDHLVALRGSPMRSARLNLLSLLRGEAICPRTVAGTQKERGVGSLSAWLDAPASESRKKEL